MTGERQHMVGYTRVSTEEQERSGLGVEAQRAAILSDADRRRWTVELMEDLGCSGKHVNPSLRHVLDLLSSGQFDGLVVAKLDRLARSVDLTTPGGRAIANMLATFAELKRPYLDAHEGNARGA